MRFKKTTYAITALLVLMASILVGVAPAEAQAGYRVCVAWNSSDAPEKVGTGMAVKVGRSSGDICQSRLAWIQQNYARTYRGSSVGYTKSMITCEDFSMRLVSQSTDLCTNLMKENVVYRFNSAYDKYNPQPFDGMFYVAF